MRSRSPACGRQRAAVERALELAQPRLDRAGALLDLAAELLAVNQQPDASLRPQRGID